MYLVQRIKNVACLQFTLSGLAHPTSFGNNTRLIMPGTTIKNIGKTLIHPVRIVAPCASVRDRADRAFCTIICKNQKIYIIQTHQTKYFPHE